MDTDTPKMRQAIAELHPAYFAMVMSTGIVSIALDGLGVESIALALFVLNVPVYAVLCVLFAVRIVGFFDAFVADMKHPRRCWGFFTFVVGTNTLGSQFYLFSDLVVVSQLLWFVGLGSWVFFMYVIYFYLISHYGGPLSGLVSGGTLLTVVATQSVTVLGSQLTDTFGSISEFIYLISLTHFATGWVLYLIFIVLVTYVLLTERLEPADWEGPYWITMGAAAITTLAGSNMLLYLDMGNLFESTLVVTYLAWAAGVWWLPILLYMDVWTFTRVQLTDRPFWVRLFPWARLGFGRGNRHFYAPPSWGRVFPMGMFTASTIALTEASGFDVLFLIPSVWGWFALLTWVLTFLGTVRAVGRVLDDGVGRSTGEATTQD